MRSGRGRRARWKEYRKHAAPASSSGRNSVGCTNAPEIMNSDRSMIASVQRSYSDLLRDRTKTTAFQKRKRAIELANRSPSEATPVANATKMIEPRAISPILMWAEKKNLRRRVSNPRLQADASAKTASWKGVNGSSFTAAR